MARIILKKGSNINHKDANGISPLHISVKYGHLNIAKFLIENEADVDITDNVRANGWSSKEGPYDTEGMHAERVPIWCISSCIPRMRIGRLTHEIADNRPPMPLSPLQEGQSPIFYAIINKHYDVMLSRSASNASNHR